MSETPGTDSTPPSASPPPEAPPEAQDSILSHLDAFMAAHPFHVRLLPLFVFLSPMLLIWMAGEAWLPATLVFTLPIYGLLAFMLWRYRKLMPEMTLRFHWTAIPTGVGLFVVWVLLGWLMAGELDVRLEALSRGELLGDRHAVYYEAKANADPTDDPGWLATTDKSHWVKLQDPGAGYGGGMPLFWATLAVKALGMVLLVPLFEEVFSRSLCMRAMVDPRRTKLALAQLLEEVPGVGDWLYARYVDQYKDKPSFFTQQFLTTPLGTFTWFAVCTSTLVFMLNHGLRDWPGCVACGVVWCWQVWYVNTPRGAATTAAASAAVKDDGMELNHDVAQDPALNRPVYGLGPVSWSHAITNALLLGYCVYSGDWQFV